jgi:hypothetical protein
MVQAEQFLRGASPTFRKTVETAIALSNHADAAQRAIGQNFWSTVIQEQSAKLDKDEEPTPHHDYGVKSKGTKFVREETLAGGNKNGTDGSEQSTDNTEPYPQEGENSEDGQKDMQKMSDTENQMTETFPMPGAPGQMPGMGGMDPNLMKQMAPQMPQVPQMNTPQSIQQMQYTVQEAMKHYVGPLREQVIKLTKANSFLAKQVREMQTMKTGLDLHSVIENRPGRVQETLPRQVANIGSDGKTPRIYEKSYNLETARQDILSIDKMISNQS